jgi:hypothetical protein
MHCSFRIYFVLAFSLIAVFDQSADAFPRRFSRRSSTSYGSGGVRNVAPTADAASTSYRQLNALYSYDKAMEEDVAFTDRIRVFLLVRDEQILKSPEAVVAEVKLTDLSNSTKSHVVHCPVTFQPSTNDYQLAVFDVANTPDQDPVVQPAKVYRMFINLHRKSDKYNQESVFGKVNIPYYVATADDNRIGRARQHIAMRTFKEFYYAENGWASRENYPMDCYAYYTWATGSCTVGAQNGRAVLGRLFGGRRPYAPGGAISTIAQRGAIHGDYAQIPGHHFMLLAYDPETRNVWTMEGNFNSTIKIVIRAVDSSWTIGHLEEEHVNPLLFQASRVAATEATSPPPL